MIGLAGTLTGCTSTTDNKTPDASSVVQQLGQVPIPTPPPTAPTPTASPDHSQLLAIGEPVVVTLPDGVKATVTALGPDYVMPTTGSRPPDHVSGTITITARMVTGTLALHTADFSSQDDTGKDIRLAASGPADVTANVGGTATLRLAGTFSAGAAQITWRVAGKVIALWDFTIETD
jgi:hypothetical protein